MALSVSRTGKATTKLEIILDRPDSPVDSEDDDYPSPIDTSTTLVLKHAYANFKYSNTTIFRRLVWESILVLEVHLVILDSQGDQQLVTRPNTSELLVYFVQAPQNSYLSLLLADVRRYFSFELGDKLPECCWFENEKGEMLSW
jgi:hypothetical protein